MFIAEPEMIGEKAIWNEVSTDFDPEEETANFGTRHALETGGSLYEVVTLATIEPSGETSSSPSVLSVATPTNVIVSADGCLLVFSSNCSEVTPIVFHHNINTFSVSSCCRFLTAGLQNGCMQMVYLPSCRVLSSQQLCEARDEEMGLTFSSSVFTGDPGLVVQIVYKNATI